MLAQNNFASYIVRPGARPGTSEHHWRSCHLCEHKGVGRRRTGKNENESHNPGRNGLESTAPGWCESRVHVHKTLSKHFQWINGPGTICWEFLDFCLSLTCQLRLLGRISEVLLLYVWSAIMLNSRLRCELFRYTASNFQSLFCSVFLWNETSNWWNICRSRWLHVPKPWHDELDVFDSIIQSKKKKENRTIYCEKWKKIDGCQLVQHIFKTHTWRETCGLENHAGRISARGSNFQKTISS